MLLLLCVIPLLFLIYYSKTYSYWSKKNVKHDFPLPIFGNSLRQLCRMMTISEMATEMYFKYPDEKVVGYYKMGNPELIIRDIDIAKRIFLVDFDHFYNRGAGRNPKVDPLYLNFGHANGDGWKLFRTKVTQVFTAAKIKAMFPAIVQSAKMLQMQCVKIVKTNAEVEAWDLMARYTIHVIGRCGFGIEVDTIDNVNSHFRRFSRLFMDPPLKNKILAMIWDCFPFTRNFLKVNDEKIERTVTLLLEDLIKQRNNKPSERNDFIDLLIKLKIEGKIRGESIEKTGVDGKPAIVEREVDTKFLMAQVFVYFTAGFETSALSTSYTLHQLAFHPDQQRRVQQHIDEVLLRYNGELCYKSVSEMNVLQMAFYEAMRLLPVLGNLPRVCVKEYRVPELNLTIEPGTNVKFAIQGVHTDPKYYENPKQFRLDRFTPEEVQKRPKFTFLPYGEGPRMCVGK